MDIFITNSDKHIEDIEKWASDAMLISKSHSFLETFGRRFRKGILVEEDKSLTDQIHEIIRQIDNNSPSQVYCFSESLMVLSGVLREHYKIPGFNLNDAIRLRNKAEMKQAFEIGHLKSVPYVHTNDKDEASHFIAEYSRVVAKPIWGTNAEDCKIIDSSSFEEWTKTRDLQKYIFEKYVISDEYHVDALISGNGDILFCFVSEYFSPQILVTHYGSMHGSVTGTQLSSIDASIISLFAECVRSFDMSSCLVHAEYLRHKETGEIFISEIAGRPGGGRIQDNLEKVYGVNLIREHIRETKGLTVTKLDNNTEPKAGAFLRLPARAGVVVDFTDISIIAQTVGVVEVTYDYKRGDMLKMPEWLKLMNKSSYTARGRFKFGDVFLLAQHKDQVIEIAQKVFDLFYLETIPVSEL